MNTSLLKAYKAEYENTSITLEELKEKYQIAEESLGDTSGWKKPKPMSPPPTHLPTVAPSIELVDDDEKTMLDEIEEIKGTALIVVKEFFDNADTDYTTTKEFKEMIGVLKDLEAGELAKEGKGGPTVNIAIQQLIQGFKDDC